MLGTQDLTLFIISGLLLNIAPGPDSILIMTRSATQGWRAGSAAALGIGAGTCVHVLAAALGLSALLAASSWAFTVIKWVGAAYLVWIGLQMLLSRKQAGPASPAAPPAALPYRKIFAQGFLTNVLNPKVALFFLAFVPQFIAPEAPHKALAFILLGAIFNLNGMLWCHFLAVCTALASSRLRVGAGLARWLNRGIGALFLSFGIKLALSER
ncbi:LysE family translocator [Paucibacter sp. PLA-PC-4]|uniref:LysE family translocator n=1 Tax=Paucibacter sp. PLA-PC-4 TaxID=2993655 RepID=UPI002249232D|nr:LysE family translocator [Paucibacter sp. PLA-PC-4]MCX2862075.1 LysE family translocator [Paucibacter sp. PLA-PC-4]